MFSLNQLHLGPMDGRDFVLCAAHALVDFPPGTEAESPVETLWQLRRALSRFGLQGVRDFLRKNNLVLDFADPSCPDDGVQILEQLIERKQVVGVFLQSGSDGSGTLRVPSFASSVEQPSIPLSALALAAGLPSGKVAHSAVPSQRGPGKLGSPASGLSDATGGGPNLSPGSGPGLPARDLVEVANKYLAGQSAPGAPGTTASASEQDATSTGPSVPGPGETSTRASSSSLPVAALAPTPAAQQNTFTLKVVDEFGRWVSGVEVKFGATPKTSGSAGPTVYAGAEPNLQVTLGDPMTIADALKKHYQDLPSPPSGQSLTSSADTMVVVSRPASLETPEDSPFQPFSLAAGETKTVSLKQGMKRAKFIGLHNTLFRTNSAVVNPEGEAPSGKVGEHESTSSVGIVASILRYNEEHPGNKLFIAGHTDRAGEGGKNVDLSQYRADAVLALIQGNKVPFVAACKARHSEVDVTQLMDWTNRQHKFKCKPTVMDRAPSDENYYLFRQSYKAWIEAVRPADEPDARGEPISATGRLTDDIWSAMFFLYEHNLRQELGEDGKGVGRLRGLLQWVEGSEAVGYGEKHTTIANTPDGQRSDADRRVEAIFFAPGEEPVLSAKNGDDIWDKTAYQQEPIPTMVSAKKWTAEWDEPVVHLEEKRVAKLAAPGLPAAQPMKLRIEISGYPDAVCEETISSSAEETNYEYSQWDLPDEPAFAGELSAGQEFPAVEYSFVYEGGGRTIKALAPCKYSDSVSLEVRFEDGATALPLFNEPYTVISPWGFRKGQTNAEGVLTEKDLPPGGVMVALRNRIVLAEKVHVGPGWNRD